MPFSVFSMEKQNFGFFALYPINIAQIFLNLLSSNPSKISSCFTIDIKFLRILTQNGIINKIAALDNDVNGVTGFSESVAIGAITANAINANASAPPNNPILQIKITNGYMINAIQILSKYGKISEFMKINKNPTLPNTIQ